MSQLGYAFVRKEIGGQTYTFRFYVGFPSAISFRPPNSTEYVEVYRQNCIFEVNGTGPSPKSTLTITGPDGLTAAVDIDDSVTPKVKQFKVDLRKSDGEPGPTDNPAVKGKPGQDKRIKAIVVTPPATEQHVATGGVEAFQDNDGGSVDVKNEGETCPPAC